MEDRLQQVIEIQGVDDVWLGDASGTVYAQLGKGALGPPDAVKLCKQLSILFAGLHAVGRGVEELDVCYEGIRAIARGFHGSAVVALCSPEVDIAMLRLTLNVVLAQMKAEPKIVAKLPGWEQMMKNMKGEDIQEILASLQKAPGGEV